MKKFGKIFLACTVCCISVFCLGACSGEQSVYWKYKCMGFRNENSTFEKGQIIFVGDSITDGYDLDKFYSQHNLPLKLYNRGIGGDTTSGVLQRMDVSLFDLQPSKIVILIGINDLKGGKSSEYVLNNYREILDKIKTRLPQCQVYIQSIYPVRDGFYANISKNTAKILEANAKLTDFAEEFDYTYIDLFSELRTADDRLDSTYADDGLHPNDTGYQKITDCLITYIQT